MKYYAVIDTNILVSVLMSTHKGTAIDTIWNYVLKGTIIPMINDDILLEYSEVLHRDRFAFTKDIVDGTLSAMKLRGRHFERVASPTALPDPDDTVFYEVSLSRDDSYLITGNLKHFPKNGRIVSPAEMVQIIELLENNPGLLNDPSVDYMSNMRKNQLRDEQAIIEKARRVTEQIRAQAVLNGMSEMTLEEINEEIRKARAERRARKEKEEKTL